MMHMIPNNTVNTSTGYFENTTLALAADAAARAIETRNAIPILDNLWLSSSKPGILNVTGTDLDMWLTASISADVPAGFNGTFSNKRFRNMLKKADRQKQIQIDMPAVIAIPPRGEASDGTYESEEKATITIGKTTVRMESIPPQDFPDDISFGKTPNNRFNMSGEEFCQAMEMVRGAISTEETRYYLNGIYIHAEGGKLIFVATDGHRLYHKSVDAPNGADGMPGLIVPTKTVKVLEALTRGKAQPDAVCIECTDTWVRFSFRSPNGVGLALTSKVIDGTFPDYRRLHNDSFQTRAVRFDAAEMIAGIRSVAVITDEKMRIFQIDFADGKAGLFMRNENDDESSTEVDIELDGEPIDTAFNHSYLIDAIEATGSSTVRVGIADTGGPIKLTTGNDDGWYALLMPARR